MAEGLEVNFTAALESGLEALDIPAPEPAALALLQRYFAELEKWGRKINLVARAAPEQIIENHFLDSLTLLPLIAGQKARSLLDVGSGAGFPGLALKISRPELTVTLVEPRQKRVAFLRHVIRTLRLDNIKVIEERLREDKEAWPAYGQPDIITCRALTAIGPFLKMLTNCPPRGTVICMKGPRLTEELKAWQQDDPASPFKHIKTLRFTMPGNKAERALAVFAKN
ncbi:16S rRNA (guanine(527)-N(7))-methyltransferase [hydrothermal vent metagenome]|uniref:16S rRNA (Guanine(527)-N(7))-methyltransferase n=1 Tax=hydrothermal vent metagenome TaxID=652676 RepID=A0A3B0UVV3_9ZZZZ